MPDLYDLYISQSVILDKGVYTVSGIIKHSRNIEFGMGAYIDVEGASIKGRIRPVVSDIEWQSYTLTFAVEEDNTIITVKLLNDNFTIAYFDNIQINKGFLIERYNLVENSSFENGSYGWGITSGTIEQIETDDIYRKILGNYAIKIEGNPIQEKSIKQTINIYDSNISIQIGGWAKADKSNT